MKLAAGMSFGAGNVAGGRRLAVACWQFTFLEGGEGVPFASGVASALRVRFSAWSDVAPQPASVPARSTIPAR